MKSGLAAGLAAMTAWAADPGRDGNLLFLAVPDEEANSAGARSAAQALPALVAGLGLELVAAINLDSLVDAGDGSAGRRVALGTVGKLLPSALVVGRPAHAADALGGLNAAALMAAIVAELEWAPELTDRAGDEQAAPPTLLGLSDHRPAYDVTMPERVWAYWNVMTLERRPDEVLAGFVALCRRAVARALGGLAERAAVLGGAGALPAAVAVLTFAQVRAAAGEAALHELAGTVQARGLELPEQCRLITEGLVAAEWPAGTAGGRRLRLDALSADPLEGRRACGSARRSGGRQPWWRRAT